VLLETPAGGFLSPCPSHGHPCSGWGISVPGLWSGWAALHGVPDDAALAGGVSVHPAPVPAGE